MKDLTRLATITIGAFATVAAAACAGAPTAPEPAAQLPADALFSVDGGLTTTESDSVVGGYGTTGTGGLEYTCFEYDPATQTEYVVSDDPDAMSKGMICTSTSEPEIASPPPPPPAPTGPSKYVAGSSGPTPPPPAPEDSVQSGYGSGSTGGIEYEGFEYEPETGTEYVATPDTTGRSTGLTSTGAGPTAP